MTLSFFIFFVEQDTDKRVNLKNVHMMTDKTNCSQLQVNFDKISNTLLVRFDRPSLLLAALQAEYTMGKALINIIASHTEIEILLKFDF